MSESEYACNTHSPHVIFDLQEVLQVTEKKESLLFSRIPLSTYSQRGSMKFHSPRDTRARPRYHQSRRSNFAEASGDLLATHASTSGEDVSRARSQYEFKALVSGIDNSSLFPLILQSSFQEAQIFIILYSENRYPICTLNNKKWYQNWRSRLFYVVFKNTTFSEKSSLRIQLSSLFPNIQAIRY